VVVGIGKFVVYCLGVVDWVIGLMCDVVFVGVCGMRSGKVWVVSE